MRYVNLDCYTPCTPTYDFNNDFKDMFGYKKPDGNYYSIIRQENVLITDEEKEKIDYYTDKKFNNNLLVTLESKCDIKFEFKKVPKYDINKPLYLLVYREKLKKNYNIIYCIGYKSIHNHYWDVYTGHAYKWVTVYTKDIIFWHKLRNEVLIKGIDNEIKS